MLMLINRKIITRRKTIITKKNETIHNKVKIYK